MKTQYLFAPFLAAALLAPAALPAAAQTAPETMARNCYTCHGTGGHPVNGLTPLAGVEAKALEASLLDFKNGRRPATIMNRIARGFSDEQIAALSDYLSKLR